MKGKYCPISMLVIALSLFFSTSAPGSETSDPVKTVMEWMTGVIAPNSDVLWNVDDPGTAAEWQALGAAAQAIIQASRAIEQNALNPAGEEWSSDTAWQDLNTRMKQAAVQAKSASEARDLDKLFEAGDALYPPCETCHLQYNPAVTQQQ